MTLIWHPMHLPPAVVSGSEVRVLVAWRSRADASQASSAEMYYLNAMVLYFDEPPAAMERQSNGWYTCTGWYDRVASSDDSVLYEPMDEQFVEHLGWTHMPIMPDAGRVEGPKP